MSLLDEELNALTELGATTGQIEHRLLEIGLRDPDQPTADIEWWTTHVSRPCNFCAPDGGQNA